MVEKPIIVDTETPAGAPGETPAGAPVQDTAARLLAAVVTADRMLNAMSAVRAGLIEALRAAAVDPDPDDPTACEGSAPGAHTLRGFWQDMDLASVTAELACALHLPQTTAGHLIDEAQALTGLPATAAALGEGLISYRHARTMITAVADLDPDARARAETTLVPKAKKLTVAAFTQHAHRERDRLDPVPVAVRHERAATGRTVLLEGDLDGMAWLHAHLPASTATAIFNRLTDTAASLQHPEDGRTLPQLRADVLGAIMLDDDAHDAFTHALGDPAGTDEPDDDEGPGDGPGSAEDRRRLRTTMRGIRPTVAVTVPVLTLLGGDTPGELEGYGPIDPETARDLCGRAPTFLRILTHPHTGAVLGVDRDRYTVPADLKAWLRLRDEHCRFPGCARRARRCDLDHVTDWARGGATDQKNLIHLCRTHHRMRHHTPWTAHITTHPPDEPRTGDPGPGEPARPTGPLGASVHWTAPSGRTYTTTDALHGRHTPDDHAGHDDHAGYDRGADPPPDPDPPEPPAPRSRFPDDPPF